MAGAQSGGAEGFFERLVPSLSDAGAPQSVVLRHNVNRANRLRNAGVSVSEAPFQGGVLKFLDRSTPKRIRQEIDRNPPKLILAWMNRAAAALPSQDLQIPKIGRLGGYYDLKYYKNCTHLIANTQDLVRYIKGQGWPEDRVAHLPNFVDPQELPPLKREAFQTPENVFLVCAMGRLHENKAFDVLLDAIAATRDIWLWLAGAGPLDAALKNQVDQLGIADRVRFLGWRDDIGALHGAADVFVCPSRHEPLGNVVLEAWAHKKPVVATKAQGPQEYMVHEQTGLLVDIDHPQQMADALTRLQSDSGLRKHLAAKGYAAFEEKFTKQRVVTAYLDYFRAILKEFSS